MRTKMTTHLPWLAVVLLFTAAAALHVQRAVGASSPETAVRLTLEAQGARVSGPCDAAVSPRDIGQVCFRLVESQGSVHAYLAGRTFSEYSQWLFVGERAGEWVVLEQQPLDGASQSLEIPWPTVR